MADLDELDDRIETCTKCDLHENRTNAVPGEGPEDADVMLIGEAPGYNEDQQGRPFVGKAGDILTDLLNDAGLERDEVFIGNVIKCKPPENRDPTDEEIETCLPYLKEQIREIGPKLIVSLGRIAGRTLLDRAVKVSEEHGKLKDIEFGGWSCKLFVSYHPAAALYGGGTREKLEKDFEKLGEIVKNIGDFKTSRQTTL